MAHIDPVGTLLFPLLQMFTGFPLIGWAKPVPVNAAHLRNPRRDQILVSLAGPASNLTAAAAAFLLLALFRLVWPEANGVVLNMAFSFRVPLQGSAAAPLVGFLFFALVINLALALFNLIPIPPLDGHWVLYELLPPGAARALAGLSSYGILLLYALMILGMFDFIFVPIRRLLDLLVSF
jgi:Zn-dependent protease